VGAYAEHKLGAFSLRGRHYLRSSRPNILPHARAISGSPMLVHAKLHAIYAFGGIGVEVNFSPFQCGLTDSFIVQTPTISSCVFPRHKPLTDLSPKCEVPLYSLQLCFGAERPNRAAPAASVSPSS
jgi:hypothetical protein